MVRKEIKELNGKQFNYACSDEGRYIQDENGNKYAEAYDPIEVEKEYIETDELIEQEEIEE